jgi:hypothetical protein
MQFASKNVPRYRRATSIAGSIPYAEQFLMTGGVGTGAANVAKGATKAITKGVTSKLAQGAAKRLIKPVVEGTISMVGRVPITPMTYSGIAEKSIGDLKQIDGNWYVDPEAMPSIATAIGKGTYNSAKEIFTESLGGMVALPNSLMPKVLSKVITPAVKKYFTMLGLH